MSTGSSPKQETDVQRIEMLLNNVEDLARDIKTRVFLLHEPPLEATPEPASETPVLVGKHIIYSLANIRDILQNAVDALEGFN